MPVELSIKVRVPDRTFVRGESNDSIGDHIKNIEVSELIGHLAARRLLPPDFGRGYHLKIEIVPYRVEDLPIVEIDQLNIYLDPGDPNIPSTVEIGEKSFLIKMSTDN